MRSDSSVSTRVLITGGTGFVGPHLIRLLRAKNNQIAVLSSDKPSTREPGVKYYEADIRDGETVGAVVRETRPEHVYHLAGISAVDTSWRNSRLTYEVNVMGSFNVFEAAMSLPSPPRILNVSSSQVYAGATGKLTEKSPLQPDKFKSNVTSLMCGMWSAPTLFYSNAESPVKFITYAPADRFGLPI